MEGYFEDLKKTLSSRSDTRTEQVTVNQRHLIDKILARYSAEYTVYREVLQNSNDALATLFEVSFSSTAPRRDQSVTVSSIILRNDGREFSGADWSRLKSIAEGNPDEQKIGFFGVGFYSLFSICEDPMVISGDQCLSFYWTDKDQLFTRMATVSRNDADAGMTTIYLHLREPIDLPNMDSFAQFFAKSLLFTNSLARVQVSMDGKPMFKIERLSSSEQKIGGHMKGLKTHPNGVFTVSDDILASTFQLSLHKYFSSEPESKGFFNDLWRSARESLSKSSDLYEAVRKPGTFTLFARIFKVNCTVSLSHKVTSELERVTKKRPAKSVTVCGVYLSHTEKSASDLTAASDKVRHPVLYGVLPLGITSRNPIPTGRLFIAFETHQTTGLAAHCSGPFIPTVERESIDFVDSAVRIWNQECIGVAGLLLRAVWDYEIGNIDEDVFSQEYASKSEHLIRSFTFSQTAPIPVIGDILRFHYLLNSPAKLMVPSSVGVRAVDELRIIPIEMKKFLVNTPQLLVNDISDFNSLISSISGVKEADADDLVRELQNRLLSHEETAAAIKWCIEHRTYISKGTFRDLYRLLSIPVGSIGGLLKPLSHVKFYSTTGDCNWPLPEDCVSSQFSELLGHSEWQVLGIIPLPISVWLDHTISLGLNADTAEDILIFLSKHGRQIDLSEQSTCVSKLKSVTCIPCAPPDSTNGGTVLRRPHEVFMENIVSFGMHLPTISVSKRHLISDHLLKALGVRTHLPAEDLLSFIESSNWDAYHLIRYLSTIQDDFSQNEMERLQNAAVFSEGATTDRMQPTKKKMSEMHRDSKAARVIGLSVFTSVDLSDDGQVRLLRRLGFNFTIPFPILLEGIQTTNNSLTVYQTLYQYLFEHIDSYRRHVNEEMRIVLCSDMTLQSTSHCFTDQRSQLLGLPVLNSALSAASFEQYLGISRKPSSDIVVQRMKSAEANVTDDLISFIADCEWSDADLYVLRSFPFIRSTDGLLKTPKESFFKVPVDFATIFSQVDPTLYTLPSPKIKHFLRSCGVQEEPSANELMIACHQTPDALLFSLGPKKYTALLRLFSVHLDDGSISGSVFESFKKSKSLIGLLLNDAQEVSLHFAHQVFISDDAISQRQFGIPVSPSDLDSFYRRMGCKLVSESVQKEFLVSGGSPDMSHSSAVECGGLVGGRCKVIVFEAFKGKLIDETAALESLRRLQFAVVPRLLISKTFQAATKTFPTTACYSQSAHAILITADKTDTFDLAGSVVECLHEFFSSTSSTTMLSDTLLVSTLLSMPIEALRQRGFLRADSKSDLGGELEGLSIKVDNKGGDIKAERQHEHHQDQEERRSREHSFGRDTRASPPQQHPQQQPISKPQRAGEKKPKFIEKLFSVLGVGKDLETADGDRSAKSMKNVLGHGVKASRANHGSTIYKEQAKKMPPPIHDPLGGGIEGECAIANDLICVGNVSGFEYYTVACSQPKPQIPEDARTLAAILSPLSTIFQLDPRSMHIFHDPASRSIAFNRGGSLFFNAHYMAMAATERPIVFWYMTACHELAHNFHQAHDMRHEHYMMAYAEMYLEGLLPYL